MQNSGTIYLIPTVLADNAEASIPAYVLDHIKSCECFFVENERTTRRWFKKIWPAMVIDHYSWYTIHKAEQEVMASFRKMVQAGKKIGIVSEAGCPGIADPGQLLIQAAQELGAVVKPLVGPNSILLALMASGLNGQSFRFRGYLPIDTTQRLKMLKTLEQEALKEDCTQIFIETPFRNNAIIKDVVHNCQGTTRFCIAANLTDSTEMVVTKTIQHWKTGTLPELHKQPVIYLLGR